MYQEREKKTERRIEKERRKEERKKERRDIIGENTFMGSLVQVLLNESQRTPWTQEDIMNILGREQTCGCKGEGGGEGLDWEFGISRCKLLYITQGTILNIL